ncbi:MAG: nickel-dependent lactate racemase [Candidatus Eisenbacteria bacterium]
MATRAHRTEDIVEVRVPYGVGFIAVDIPERNVGVVVRPNASPATREEDVIRRALADPVGSPSLESFLVGVESLVVVVNDAMRPTPTARVLALVNPELRRVPDVTLVVATGAHRAPTDDELARILGDLLAHYGWRVVVHDARRPEDMVSVGVTSRGNEVLLNRVVAAASDILIVGSVEPHYFAGWTGGRKSLLPGVAAFETIERNHGFAMDPAARPAALEGNPVHEDMADAARLLGDRRIFTVMTVLDADQCVCAAAAGDIEGAFAVAVGHARGVFEVPVEEHADVVVAVAGPPLDVDLYQSHKALEHGRLALKEGGSLILVSECREGVGERAYVDLLARAGTPQEALGVLEESYRFGHHKVAHIADMACRANLSAVTSLSETDVLESIFVTPFASLQDAVDAAIEREGLDARVLFLMDAGVTVPRVG